MSNKDLLRNTAAALEKNAKAVASHKTLVGLDGFVDAIITVVDKRESPTKFSRLETITQFAQRVGESAGKSGSIEMVVERVKLGGNGPIMGNALASFGTRTTYLGAVGYPRLHDAFAPLAANARVISVAEPGHTHALEFDDGKIMLGTLTSLYGLTWKSLCERVGKDKLRALVEESSLVAMTNWTMLPAMTDIWRRMQKEICPKLRPLGGSPSTATEGVSKKSRTAGTPSLPSRILFADLADPTRRSAEDVREALKVLKGFQKWFRVVLGLNEKEAELVSHALGFETADGGAARVREMAESIQSQLQFDAIVVHPREYAVSASRAGFAHVDGPFTPKPLISTGAGDHFNAGYCLGRLFGLDEASSLQAGVGTSGFYVRTGKSPSCKELAKFLKQLSTKNDS